MKPLTAIMRSWLNRLKNQDRIRYGTRGGMPIKTADALIARGLARKEWQPVLRKRQTSYSEYFVLLATTDGAESK